MDFASALLCMTLTIFKEAEGEGLEGMRMVGDVIINRIESEDFPKDVCEVVLQPKQFSWVNKLPEKSVVGLIDVQSKTLHNKSMNSIRLNAYRDAEAVARYVLSKDYKPRYQYLYFYSGDKRPHWAKHKRGHKKGRHTFTG